MFKVREYTFEYQGKKFYLTLGRGLFKKSKILPSLKKYEQLSVGEIDSKITTPLEIEKGTYSNLENLKFLLCEIWKNISAKIKTVIS